MGCGFCGKGIRRIRRVYALQQSCGRAAQPDHAELRFLDAANSRFQSVKCSKLKQRASSQELSLHNYFNYFTETEENFQRRRGGILMLSTLDWALIETWKDAGIPLEAVLRGIDTTFDHYEQRPSKTRKINGLGFCAQEVLAAAEAMKEAAIGTARASKPDSGFDPTEVARFLRDNAARLQKAELPSAAGVSPQGVAIEASRTLNELAEQVEGQSAMRL